jgi:hypothetical protein
VQADFSQGYSAAEANWITPKLGNQGGPAAYGFRSHFLLAPLGRVHLQGVFGSRQSHPGRVRLARLLGLCRLIFPDMALGSGQHLLLK